MTRLRKFALLNGADRWLLIRTFILMSTFRLLLYLTPRSIAVISSQQGVARPVPTLTSGRIVWAVGVAARYVHGASCLVQALTAKTLLERAGLPANVRIGVAKTKTGAFEAHAWVEAQGNIITGGNELEHYSPLPLWKS